ncbi:hypothetical protein [Sphingobium aquiterrae]|uniref:hypothetical protein n=1 Tax=Sphingobium aquiterrae TaxID=2038656 RepID=UPI00301AEE46
MSARTQIMPMRCASADIIILDDEVRHRMVDVHVIHQQAASSSRQAGWQYQSSGAK